MIRDNVIIERYRKDISRPTSQIAWIGRNVRGADVALPRVGRTADCDFRCALRDERRSIGTIHGAAEMWCAGIELDVCRYLGQCLLAATRTLERGFITQRPYRGVGGVISTSFACNACRVA